jgi:hypothetical protein
MLASDRECVEDKMKMMMKKEELLKHSARLVFEQGRRKTADGPVVIEYVADGMPLQIDDKVMGD